MCWKNLSFNQNAWTNWKKHKFNENTFNVRHNHKFFILCAAFRGISDIKKKIFHMNVCFNWSIFEHNSCIFGVYINIDVDTCVHTHAHLCVLFVIFWYYWKILKRGKKGCVPFLHFIYCDLMCTLCVRLVILWCMLLHSYSQWQQYKYSLLLFRVILPVNCTWT